VIVGRFRRGAALAALALTSGCNKARERSADEWPDDGRWWADGAGSSGVGGANDGDGEDVDVSALGVGARQILGAHCGPCHAGRPGSRLLVDDGPARLPGL
jgi:hypothetical protein